MIKQPVSEQQLEALTISNGSILPILSYNEIDLITSTEQMQRLQTKAIRYFGSLGLVQVTKDKTIIDANLLALLECSKANEKFFVFEHFKQQDLVKQLCFYPSEYFVGVEKKVDELAIFHAEELEYIISSMLEGNRQLKVFPKEVEVIITKNLYLQWMSAINAKDSEKAREILKELNVDELSAEKIVRIFMTKENFMTLSMYKKDSLQAKILVMITDYPVVIQFNEQPEISLQITSVTYEELSSYAKDFIVYAMNELEGE